MSRDYTSLEAIRLLNRHQDLLEKLIDGQGLTSQQRTAVKASADKLLGTEVIKCLQDVPLEELNRDKKGIRIKALQDYGYSSFADLCDKSVYQLSTVKGISEDTARTIRRVTDEYIKKLNKSTKIRISTDNRTKAATELVKTIAIYLRCKPWIEECKDLLSANKQNIE